MADGRAGWMGDLINKRNVNVFFFRFSKVPQSIRLWAKGLIYKNRRLTLQSQKTERMFYQHNPEKLNPMISCPEIIKDQTTKDNSNNQITSNSPYCIICTNTTLG